MNELIKKLATQSYDNAFVKCKNMEHPVTDVDPIFAGFAMKEMAELVAKECALIAGLKEHQDQKMIGSSILDAFGIK